MRTTQKAFAALTAAATLIGLAACGGGSDNASKGSTGDANKAELVFWGWDTGHTMTNLIKDFQKANPGITVKFNNTGTASDTQTALSNAIAAGKGAPDVVMLEDPTVTQFAVTGDLADLSQFGADKLADDFSAGPWNKLQYNNKPYALPIDSGPEMFFYNDAVFKKAGVDGTKIKTWDDYYEAAKKVKAAGSYMTNNSGSSMEYQPFTAQAWQAGAQPWKVDGEKITIDMTNDAGMKKYIDFQQKLIDEDLIDTKTANWSDDWNRELNDGTIASLFTGAWMPANLANSAADGAGKWRVTQMPTADGSTTNSENGGSSLAVLASTKKADAAYQFIEYANHGDGVATRVAGGAFPADKASMESDSFKNTTTVKNADGEDVDYFGGQKYNEVLAQAAENVSSDYQFLPYEVKARTIFGDYLGKSYTGDQKLTDGIAAWQKALQDYGKDQGFTVK